MEEDYRQQREALLARLARVEQSYKENLERADVAEALASVRERRISVLEEEVNRF